MSIVKPNCFEKTKEAWGIFSFFLPQMLKRRPSVLLPITRRLAQLCRTFLILFYADI
jgi:hypothetical protein